MSGHPKRASRGSSILLAQAFLALSLSWPASSKTELSGSEFVPVPAATFQAGREGSEDASPVHAVTLTHPYEIGRTEVTNEAYVEALSWALERGKVEVDGEWVRDRESNARLLWMRPEYREIEFKDGRFLIVPSINGTKVRGPHDPVRHPVAHITWFGAAAYCNWRNEMEGGLPFYSPEAGWEPRLGDPYSAAGYRLPTEMEWEYAGAGPNHWRFPWDEMSEFAENKDQPAHDQWTRWPTDVASFSPAGDSWVGASDLVGNVWEWTYDRTGPYHADSLTDPSGPTEGRERVVRGGWAPPVSVFARSYGADSCAAHFLGFRMARTRKP